MVKSDPGSLAELVRQGPALIKRANELAALTLNVHRGTANACGKMIGQLDYILGHRELPEKRGGVRKLRHKRRVGRGRSG